MPRPLARFERLRLRNVSKIDRRRARLMVVRWLPGGAAGMTLGRFVLMKRGFERDARILAHELVHVRQWRELGRVRFLYRYLKAYFVGRLKGLSHTEAYRQIPLEAEARRLSGDKS